MAKSLPSRLIGTLDTFIFSWFITRDFNKGLNILGIIIIRKLALYA